MAILQKFLFLFKSKYRRKRTRSVNGISLLCWLLFCNFLISQYQMVESGDCKQEDNPTVYTSPFSPSICINGDCVNNSCVCRPGWRGQNCQFCTGKVKLQGIKGLISDGPGNYTTNMKCTWLIESDSIEKDVKVGNGSTLPSPIILRINEFATECGWDHLYIYDGDNVHAPLLGVFSGLLVQKNYKVLRFPEIVAKSGYALLHFYTDVAYNLTGFSIAYQSCPSDDSSADCSGNGVCVDGVCTCNAKYSGDACNIEKCPNNCSNQGTCNMELHRCQCKEGYKGHDCSQVEDQGYWEVITPLSGNPKGSASHASIVHNNSLWVFGGNTLNMDTKEPILNHYSFVENKWNSVQHKGDITPPVLYGHSCVLVENKVYLYGGVHHEKFGNRYVSDIVWSFDLTTRSWAQVSVKPEQCKRGMCGPLRLAGHTALVININEKGNKSRHLKMVVIFGHSPRYGYVNVVQEFHFGSKSWNVMTTKGYPVGGIYGHSSSWDPYSQKIYVFGGYRIGQDTAFLSNSLYSYDPMTHTWQMMESGPGGRFLHAAVVNKGLLMVFGGNGHNDTSYSIGTKCFTSEVLVYDIECDTWSALQPPSELPTDISRYGHTVEQYQESIYMYGGYNGVILNDLIRFTPAICEALYSDYQCINSRKLGVKCVWNDDKCENATNTHSKDKAKEGDIERRCSDQSFPNDAGRDVCDHVRSCAACVHPKRDCVWCGERCYANKCKDSRHKTMSNLEQCNSEDNVCGYFMHNCPLCHSETGCIWGKDDQCTKDIAPYHHNGTVIDRDPVGCEQGCADLTSCSNCTANNCMWCNDLNTCVEKNAYVISFPYGQCMSWAQSQNLCLSKDPHSSVTVSICDEVPSCDTCLSLPSCGWCDGGTGTGLGRCMDGSSRGPLIVNTTGVFINKTLCKADRWHFTDCPACQCNGHSSCDEKNNCYDCDQYTEGDHCQVCMPGFYGTAMNGGKCKPCECNSQADTCHPETGRCFCTTKGITGEDCARCDTQNSYSGDPTNGSCFYDLQIDYQFTFNLSKKEDRHYTKINFRNSPPKPDIDADFQIICSVLAKLNISVSKGGLPEKFLFTGWNCTSVKFRFSKTEYTFGNADNTTFYVYVYDFQPPLWIQIAFSQSPKLDLLHFFITFSTCFLLLLLVAAVLWKIKQKYDMYRRRQRLFVEMEQMASRPFSQVYVELGKTLIPSRMSSLRKRRKEWPSPIALEPCQGNRAAVLSLLVTLPTGSQHFAPPGQSGLSVGSALVALGNPRKVSFEPISKTEGKNNKLRKSLPSHSLNTCI